VVEGGKDRSDVEAGEYVAAIDSRMKTIYLRESDIYQEILVFAGNWEKKSHLEEKRLDEGLVRDLSEVRILDGGNEC